MRAIQLRVEEGKLIKETTKESSSDSYRRVDDSLGLSEQDLLELNQALDALAVSNERPLSAGW